MLDTDLDKSEEVVRGSLILKPIVKLWYLPCKYASFLHGDVSFIVDLSEFIMAHPRAGNRHHYPGSPLRYSESFHYLRSLGNDRLLVGTHETDAMDFHAADRNNV